MNGADRASFLNADGVDSTILPAVHAGKARSLEELHSTYSRRFYKTIIAITKNHEDAEDALQDTFLRAYTSLHTFEGRSSLYSWLTRIAVNSALMILGKRRVRAEIPLDPRTDLKPGEVCLEITDSLPDPEQVCDQSQRQTRLQRAISDLDGSLRGPIRMRINEEASMSDIGRAFGISEGAVKARLHRARRRLYKACGSNLPGDVSPPCRTNNRYA
ncbi:MAG: sigma-70 family RNA polymerase sigma factor [Terracidiphilus sp.]